ncbi:calcium-binding protein [Pseudomonas moraviensis subsp. stanleyae]|uniref:calcium-binding protein n=1 Tax=Pseudomonas moraviensis TaxID=321662 RepID=UPI002E3159EF|nr:calcium-binding protein [Pseudomonas moraviensis]MED7670765.1 calcium-binding protein [Pseudomonas moraviensis subsp. stanleyae]
MATLIREATAQTDPAIHADAQPVSDTVVVMDLHYESNEYKPSTIDQGRTNDKSSQLQMADDVFGPLEIGDISITRTALDGLGATIDGQPLNGKNSFFRQPKLSFINGLQFDANKVEHYLKTSTGSDSYLLPTLLFEMASQRPLTAPQLLRENNVNEKASGNYRDKLVKLFSAAQALDLQHVHVPRHHPRWAALTKSYATLGSSLGIQGFGIFMGIRGVVDAIKADNTAEIAINSAGIASELASIAADVTVSKIATQMLTAGQNAYRDFARTRFALRLGRSGGLVGGVLTLPFDIYTAVRSMNAAENATGKEAMDHYVSAGLSITSAAMTVILGTAAMAGFSFAGPVGLAAGAILAIGSQVYGAVRIVDDIDDYIELTVDERWRSGWFSFCMMDVDQSVQNRYIKAKTLLQHSLQLKKTARKLLDGSLKDSTEAIVNGKFDVRLKPARVWKRNWWTKQDAWESVNVPEVVGTDDIIDARAGVTKDTPGAELGVAAEGKNILWFISEGNDSIKGVEKKPNSFYYKSGKKQLSGGEGNDQFLFENAATFLEKDSHFADYSTLSGGAGNDTLVLGGNYSAHNTNRTGYDIDLLAGTLQIITTDVDGENNRISVLHSLLDSIENIETVHRAASVVTGNAQNNIIKSRGSDTIEAGAGDDQIFLSHEKAKASGGAGTDQYYIAHVAGRFSIADDGEQTSYIIMNWRKDLIESWEIEGNDLVIRSGFEFHDVPKNLLTIHDVYKEDERTRKLSNKNLVFITSDDFQFRLDLPDTIANGPPPALSEIFVKRGQPVTPIIIYAPECWIRHQKEASYYIPRTGQATTFYAVYRPEVITRIYLDFNSDELTKAEAHFFSDKPKSYRLTVGCHLVYHFGEKSIKLNYYAAARSEDDNDNITKILRTMAVRPFSRYVLIYKDGVVANAGLAAETDIAPAFTDFTVSRDWVTPMNVPLKVRSRRYIYALPEKAGYPMGSKRICATPARLAVQTTMDSYEGQGSSYLIHVLPDMTIKLATPGALADAQVRLPYSSTWELDATQLGEVEIKLQDNRLSVGTTTFYLPAYGSEDLIDQIRVITTCGVVHTVDLVFDRVYLDGLDARFFEEPDAAKALPQALAAMANDEVKVWNAVCINDETARVGYNFAAYGWVLRADKSRIEKSALRVVNRCNHQTNIFGPVSLMNVPPA